MEQLTAFWRKERWFIAKFALPLLLVFAFYQLLVYPYLTSIAETRSEINRLSSKTFSEEWFADELKTASSDLSLLQKIDSHFDSMAVNNGDSLYTENGFRRLAERSGLAVEKIGSNQRRASSYQHTTVVINATGSYRSFIKFLEAIEERAPLAAVASFNIRPVKGKFIISPIEIGYLQK
jgi:glycerol-3-phosphate dehydrogenase